MIKKVEIDNVRSIKHCEVSFEKNKYKYLNKMVFNNKLVSPVALYGANGSGKSSFLYSIEDLVKLLIDEANNLSCFVPNFVSLHRTIPKYKSQDLKQSFSSLANDSLSYVSLHFELEQDEYFYTISTTFTGFITNEELIVNGKHIISRNSSSYKIKGRYEPIQPSLFPLLRKFANENVNNEYIIKAYNYLSNIAFLDASKTQYSYKPLIQKKYADFLVEKSDEVKEILKKYSEFPLYDIFSNQNNFGKKEYYVNLEITENEKVKLPFEAISSGMENNSFLLSTLLSLPENGVLIIDEIEDALHPLTILDFIEVARQKNIQLIISSHNTFLLQALRPDQIFFANWKEGFSSYKRLSDIYPNIREINNIEKMYLSNMFYEEIHE